jgi:predicted nucleic acid-binding protein
MTWMKVTYLDASVAVKLLCDEPRSEEVRAYCREEAPVWITQVCFFETLGVLKAKFVRHEISPQGYFAACGALLGLKQTRFLVVDEITLEGDRLFLGVEDLARKHHLDFSDALQILSVREGRFRGGTGPSSTVLATADRALAAAAVAEGLRVWDVTRDTQPPN